MPTVAPNPVTTNNAPAAICILASKDKEATELQGTKFFYFV
jgi:hypothetical protein